MFERIFAMDTSFMTSLGTYDFAARCEILQELGYEGTYLTLKDDQAWNDIDKLDEVGARYGLSIDGIYTAVDINESRSVDKIVELLARLQRLNETVHVELAVNLPGAGIAKSDQAGDTLAAEPLRRLLGIAEHKGTPLLLYPHVTNWLERTEDAARLCRLIDHPLLGLAFSGFHWYAVDGTRLSERIAAAMPYLRSVSLCGSRKTVINGYPIWTIEPLDEGELDNFALMGVLREHGYAGPVGVQGFSVGGDVYAKLRRSLAALRDMEQRLKRHPRWAQLRA